RCTFWRMNESPWLRSQARREKHLYFWFSVRAPQRGADDGDQNVRKIALLRRIVLWAERSRSASMLRTNAHSSPDLATPVRAPGCRAGTFPHNQLLGREEREAKRSA